MNTKPFLFSVLMLAACGKPENTADKKETKKQDTRFWKNPDKDIPEKFTKHVDELVSQSGAQKEGEKELSYTLNYLDKETLKTLNSGELLYYCLAYPAAYNQNCSIDAGDTVKAKIARYLPDQFCAHHMSTLQNTLLERNRDSVILLLNGYIEKHPGKTDVAYLTVVRNLQAVECIPSVIETASNENCYNYTLLANLLTGYRPFLATGMYTKLYGYGDDVMVHNVRIEASKENVKRLCDLAMKMYNEQKIQ
ncbi:MAG TPA: hypothetical protein VD905_04985 [Flavobacteriales bacterium]|nr:hypothetical protein [Flavobacteriales bacterium]